jgi:hypothetical protein
MIKWDDNVTTLVKKRYVNAIQSTTTVFVIRSWLFRQKTSHTGKIGKKGVFRSENVVILHVQKVLLLGGKASLKMMTLIN